MKSILFGLILFSITAFAQQGDQLKNIKEFERSLSNIKIFAELNDNLSLHEISYKYTASSLVMDEALYLEVSQKYPALIKSKSVFVEKSTMGKFQSARISIDNYLTQDLLSRRLLVVMT